jgi:hypothetical protein
LEGKKRWTNSVRWRRRSKKSIETQYEMNEIDGKNIWSETRSRKCEVQKNSRLRLMQKLGIKTRYRIESRSPGQTIGCAINSGKFLFPRRENIRARGPYFLCLRPFFSLGVLLLQIDIHPIMSTISICAAYFDPPSRGRSAKRWS